MSRITNCPHDLRKHHARGMCAACYDRLQRMEGFKSTRKSYVTIDESTFEDLEMLASTRTPLHIASKRMGYAKPASLIRALYRADRKDLVRVLRRNSHSVGVNVQGGTLPRSFNLSDGGW